MVNLFHQEATAERDKAVNATLAQPIPRLSSVPQLSKNDGVARYEVVVVGAGPAGLMCNLLLARYGIPSSSRLCIDGKPASLKTGQADGIAGRTAEILMSLNLWSEIDAYAAHVRDSVTWKFDTAKNGIERLQRIPINLVKGRAGGGFCTFHQGRIERILGEDLTKYSEEGVLRDTKLLHVSIDESDPEFPVLAEVKHTGSNEVKQIRTKYLIGGDGARSVVRTSLGIEMQGAMVDDIWGVVDFVADTDFPDVRRQGFVIGDHGTILHIPREAKQNGDRIVRLYVPFGHAAESPPNGMVNGTHDSTADLEVQQRTQRKNITLDRILATAAQMYQPYRMAVKPGTEVEWWAAYQVGQRYASRMVEKDSKGHQRVFLIGDACHTHSPMAGQGMNVSMMDAYDLSWKLAHVLHGLSPNPEELLQTFAHDRLENAMNLIDMDKRWYKRRYSDIHVNGAESGIVEVRAEFSGFVTGFGIEYDPDTYLVDEHVTEESLEAMGKYLNGAIREGRRLADQKVLRFADGEEECHVQDEIKSHGRYTIMMWTADDFLERDSKSYRAVQHFCEKTIPKFPASMVKLVVLNPLEQYSFEWSDVPALLREKSEMNVYHATQEVYDGYGVDVKKGAIVAVRPDQFVGTVAWLDEEGATDKIDRYLERVLIKA